MTAVAENPVSGIQAKRETLKALSREIAVLVKEGVYDSINDGLAEIYAEQGHKTLRTFKEWNELGYSVVKGSKALLLWGSPKPIKKGEAQEQAATDEENTDKFFPICYVFSNLQVTKKDEK